LEAKFAKERSRMLLSLLLFSWNMGSPEALKDSTMDMSAWADPIYQGEAPLLSGSLFFIFDRSNGELCLYDFAQGTGPEAPKQLWRSGGFGQGPGEFPEGYKINQIAFNYATQEIWVSHAFGFNVFNSRGSFVMYHKMNVRGGNTAWVSFMDDRTVFSAFNPLHDERVIAQFATNSCLANSHTFAQCIAKKVSHVHGIPAQSGVLYMGNVVVFDEEPELYSYQGKLYHWDPVFGEMVILSSNGDILDFISGLHFIVPKGQEEVQYIEKMPRSFTLAGPLQKESGLVEAYGGLWTLIYSDKIALETYSTKGEKMFLYEEVLVKLDYDGQLLEMYRHPAFSRRPNIMQPFGFYQNRFFFFNKREKDLIQSLALDVMEKIPLPKRRALN
jgi:hypothetical protein